MDRLFLTGKKDTDIEILSELDNSHLVNACKTNRWARKLCNNPQLWHLKTITEYGIDLTINYFPDQYKNMYIKLYKFDRTLQTARFVFSDILKNNIYGKFHKQTIHRLAKYIFDRGLKDENLCKELILNRFGPEFIALKPNYPTNLLLLGKTNRSRIPTYCQQLVSIEVLQIIFDIFGYQQGIETSIWLVIKYKRLDLMYFFLRYKEVEGGILQDIGNMGNRWSLQDYKFAIESLRKVGVDLIKMFNDINIRAMELGYYILYKNIEERNITVIDYLISEGYILTQSEKDYMAELQITKPNKYGNIFDVYL